MADPSNSDATSASPPVKKGRRFWLIFLSICLALFLSALEFTAVSTALPVIVNDLHGENFVWVGSAYALASTAFLPMSGGLAEIFGRRLAILLALGIFALGSALCGSAQSMNWLIAARTVQGLGGSGILALSSIIVADLVPLRERGAYNGLTGLTWAIASAIGPLVGGALSTNGQWRWLFYLNLPVCGLSLRMVVIFLKLPTPPGSFQEKIKRLDWIGNMIIISSTTAVVIGLTWGGVSFPWSSPRVLVPLVLGLCGIASFFVYEAKVAKYPIIPFSLLSNRTSLSGYIQGFINPLVVLSLTYYLPVYCQSCKNASAFRSSIDMLGLSLTTPIAIVAGLSVTISKCYRPQVRFGWILFISGMGVFTTVKADTPLALSIGLPVLMGVGATILYAVTCFPVLSPLPVSENAHALALFVFCRSFAGVWGISIGATVLQNELAKRLPASFLSNLPGGGSGVDLSYSVIPLIPQLEEPLKQQVREAFGESVAVIWKVMTGILGIGILASLFMKGVPLHNLVDEKWGIDNEGIGSDAEKEVAVEAHVLSAD